MNSEENLKHHKHALDEIELSIKQLSEREYERDTPVIVADLKQRLAAIHSSIHYDNHSVENSNRLKEIEAALSALEPKLVEAGLEQQHKLETLRCAGFPL